MDKEKLFTPSLTEEDEKVEVYDINKFLYVAFFGGVIPLVALATKTAKQLKISNNIIAILAAAGGLILFGKYFIAYTIFNDQPIMTTRTLRWAYKAASVILYLGYYKVMKERFIIHINYSKSIKPIFKDAVIWFLIGILIEATLGFAASGLQTIL